MAQIHLLGYVRSVRATEDSLKAWRNAARRLAGPSAERAWLAIAETSRWIVYPPDGMAHGTARNALPIYREALGKLGPRSLAALAASVSEPEVSLAMIRAMSKANRVDEAAAECRDALEAWRGKDVAEIVKACQKCGESHAWGGGAAASSIFLAHLDLSAFRHDVPTCVRAFHVGLESALPDAMYRARVQSGVENLPSPDLGTAANAPAGLRLSRSRPGEGNFNWRVARADEVPFFDLSDPPEFPGSLSPVLPVYRVDPAASRIGRELARLARRQGARRVALIRPTLEVEPYEGYADGFESAAATAGLEVENIPSESGRKDRRADARAVRDRRVDAVVLLVDGNDLADWLIALRQSGTPLLVFGTDELEPAGFHDVARRASEDAMYVSTQFALPDTVRRELESESAFDAELCGLYATGWLLGGAIARGADSPVTLAQELRRFPVETNNAYNWIELPESVLELPKFRIRTGRSERLP